METGYLSSLSFTKRENTFFLSEGEGEGRLALLQMTGSDFKILSGSKRECEFVSGWWHTSYQSLCLSLLLEQRHNIPLWHTLSQLQPPCWNIASKVRELLTWMLWGNFSRKCLLTKINGTSYLEILQSIIPLLVSKHSLIKVNSGNGSSST